MANRDLHINPFDKGTIAKLEIFEDYAQAWLPTFIMQGVQQIHIFDFFSGPGYDPNKVPGSPIRLLEKIYEQHGNILQKGTKIHLHLNEFEPNRKAQHKFELLKENCLDYVHKHSKFKYFLNVNFYNENAETLFFELLPQIKSYPSLVYLDQSGIKFISKKYLGELESLRKTDFLYFVSSSFFKRYGNTDEFKQVLNLEQEELASAKYDHIHRIVLEKVKSNLSKNSDLQLFPFSIKKGSNIYGILFGATHFRAVDKFLDISWKKNEINGEANFDIDEDESKAQLEIFESSKMTKKQAFRNDLRRMILNGSISNNQEALKFTYSTGNYYRYANDLVKELKSAGKINYTERTPGVSYNNVFKKNRIIHYKINT